MTCEEFISDIRSRYAQIGTGYRNSNPDLDAIIKPVPSRIQSVAPSGNNKVISTLDSPVDIVGGNTITSDIVVLATGYNSGVRKLIADLLPPSAKKDAKLTDSEFFDKYTDFLTGRTRTSESKVTRLARSVNIYKGRSKNKTQSLK